MADTADLDCADDRSPLYVGDHVRDREHPVQTLLAAERTATPAYDYTVGETTTTVADIHLLTYPVPRARLELITPLSGGADR